MYIGLRVKSYNYSLYGTEGVRYACIHEHVLYDVSMHACIDATQLLKP
jgi:hypothetical protein